MIIDDYDQAKLSSAHSLRLLDLICQKFSSVLITASPTFTFSFLEGAEHPGVVGLLKRVEISQIGARKRYSLIEKWCLARHETTDEASLRTQVEQKRRIVNRVLGSNLVPRTPLIILILLKAMELEKVGDIARTGYVRYYKFLIDSAILKNSSNQDAEGAYALLPELAWAMHSLDTNELSPDQAESVIETFAERRALKKTLLYSVLGNLRRVGMFVDSGTNHKFRYSYAYYFFLADYMRQNLGKPEMRETVTRLCQDVATKESATILIFLAHHSDDLIIVNTLISGLEQTYVTGSQFEFTKERTSAVNKLITELPRQLVEFESSKQRREERLDVEEHTEFSSKEVEDESKSPLHTMNSVFMSVEIIGHVLRNHYARLDAQPKLVMFEAATSAILRGLGDLLDHISCSVDNVIIAVRAFTDTLDDQASEEKKIRSASKIVFILAASLLIHFSRQLVRSIGDENLEMTYKHSLDALPVVTRRYIDVLIKLDSFKDFPLEEIRKLVSELTGNNLGMTALRYAVAERLDMRPLKSDRDFHRVCDLVGLSTKPRLVARQKR